MDAIQNLGDIFADSPLSVIQSLRTFRPLPGSQLSEFAGNDPRLHENFTVNTKGIDGFISIIRMIKSFGYEVEVDGIAGAFAAAAGKEIGFDYSNDWKMKKYLLEMLDKENPTRAWSITELIDHIKPLIVEHPLFNLFSDSMFKKIDNGWTLVLNHERSITSCDGESPLEEQIWDSFFNKNGIIIGQTPQFLMIKYKVAGSSIPLSKLRILNVKVPRTTTENGAIRRGVGKRKYRLVVVVNARTDTMRMYRKNGKEDIPYIAPGIVVAGFDWSIEEDGVFILIYHQAWEEGWSMPDEIVAKAAEFDMEKWKELSSRK